MKINTVHTYKTPAFITGGTLLIALILTLSIESFNWGILDFVTMGILIFSTCWAAIKVWQKAPRGFRIIGVAAVLITFFAVWAELSVDAVSKLLSQILG